MGERLCSSPVGREFAASPFWSSHLTYLSVVNLPVQGHLKFRSVALSNLPPLQGIDCSPEE
nr:hypothetical protein ABT39_MTgene342 [Picea glauca]